MDEGELKWSKLVPNQKPEYTEFRPLMQSGI